MEEEGEEETRMMNIHTKLSIRRTKNEEKEEEEEEFAAQQKRGGRSWPDGDWMVRTEE
jgi:hypothetical protein